MTSPAYPPLRVANTVVVLLVLGMMVSLVDRQVLSLLVQPIKAEMRLSDFQFSLLLGLAFVVLYSIAGLFLGYLADRASRRNVIMACLALWSAATMACGVSGGFGQMFASRVVVGVGEAGLHPSAFSMLCDLYAPSSRGRAFGVVATAGSLGIAVASLAGASVYRWVSQHHAGLPAGLSHLAPWRLTFLAAGAPGLALAAVFLIMREPARVTEPNPAIDARSLKAFLSANRTVLALLFGHYSLYNFCCYVVLGWTPAYYMRRFGLTVYEAGMLTGVTLVVGAFGGVINGFLGDRWIARRAVGARLRIAVVSLALGVPTALVWFLAPSLIASVLAGMICFGSFAATMCGAPLVLADMTPGPFRGRAISLLLFCYNVFGMAAGPVAVAALTDFVFRDEAKVNYAMTVAAVSAMLLGALLAVLAMRRYSAAVYGGAAAAATPIAVQAPALGAGRS